MILQIHELTRKLGKFKLDRLSFEVHRGEVIAIVGPNGAGKTTLFQHILGWDRPDSGEISCFNGLEIQTDRRAILERTGFVGSECLYGPKESVKSICELARSCFSFFEPLLNNELLRLLKLDDEQRVSSMSRGQKVRLAMAMALSHNPELLLLDEATSGLDPAIRAEVLALLAEKACQEDRALIMATHHADEVERLATRVIFLKEGRIWLDTPMEHLQEQFLVTPPQSQKPSCAFGQLPNQNQVIRKGEEIPPDSRPASIEEICIAFCHESTRAPKR